MIQKEEYARKVLPHLKADYFQDLSDRTLFKIVNNFITDYNSLPSKEALLIELDKTKINQDLHKDTLSVLGEVLEIDAESNVDWLLDTTEAFCKKMAVNNAIMSAWGIIQGEDKKRDQQAIPGLLQEALAVSFETRLGHDYINDAPHQFEWYHRIEEKIPTDIELFNEITEGGMSKKTLNILIGGTYAGKSLVMCHMAASQFLLGHNVLYITLELSEEMVRERIDANLLDTPLDMIRAMPKDLYFKKIEEIESKTPGKLIIHEYPTAAAGKLQFEALLQELKIKKSFKPSVIYVDYLNLCRSSRVRDMHGGGMYEYFKYVAEELRGIAGEHNVVLVTATQLNREGFRATDFGLDNIAESFATAMTGDFIIGLQATEELRSLNQLEITQLKNRYRDINKDGVRKFLVGIDRPKMRLYDLESSAQSNIIQDLGPSHPALAKFDGLTFD